LAQEGFEVQVVMTESAHQFVGAATFAALSGRGVVADMFDPRFPLGPHIELARDYDLLCIAPATANAIGKMANGIADDLLSTLYLCFSGTVVAAPAMNVEMWESVAVTRNVQQLQRDGVHIIGPHDGWLSCRVSAVGRMAEPAELVDAIKGLLESPP
jgi:phosphopantothenoylcysteine decarboxylase/phosphopantothenate--cysteine ligase